MTTSTPSKCCGTAQIITGVLVAAGIATLAVLLFTRRPIEFIDPLTEADRRINDLEASLHRLQDTFGHVIGG